MNRLKEIYEDLGMSDVEPYDSKIEKNIISGEEFVYTVDDYFIKWRIKQFLEKGYNQFQINSLLKELEDNDIIYILDKLSFSK